MNDILVLYHGGCRDGFCAAWVVNKYLKAWELLKTKVEFVPAYYGQEPPDVKDKIVYIVDFCYPLETMKQIGRDARNVYWFDHHKTAQPIYDDISISSPSNMYTDIVFDNNRSGAGITWDRLFDGEPRPWLVDYVEDRDLWKHKLECSEEINAFIACLEFDFNVWEKYSSLTIGDAVISGKIAKMKTEQYVREVCKNVYFVDFINSNDRNHTGQFNIFEPKEKYEWFKAIPTVNICQVDCSEVLHELCKNYPNSPFSLYWFKRADGMYQYGLRSIGDFDVSKVAKLFGGGGHLHAAGFQLDYLLEELK